MTILLTTLINRVSPEVEGRVTAARDRSRAVLRDALRAECRLVMRGADDAWQVQAGRAVSMVPVGFLKGERISDHHLTLAEKIAARGKP